MRVGSTRAVKFDVRFVAATNKNLHEEMERGTFREDLYYRLNMFPLEMPALRERREDIVPLAEHFLRTYSGKYKRDIEGFSVEALARLISYGWPGNVRELENTIAYAVALCTARHIEREHLPKALNKDGARSTARLAFVELVKEAKRHIVLEALREAGGDYSVAAAALQIHSNNLHRLIRTLGLRGTRGTAE